MNKYFDRTIKVYQGAKSKVEVEGKTVTVHWAYKTPDGKTVVANGILPLDVATELTMLLGDALATPGEVVRETGLVPSDAITYEPVVVDWHDNPTSRD